MQVLDHQLVEWGHARSLKTALPILPCSPSIPCGWRLSVDAYFSNFVGDSSPIVASLPSLCLPTQNPSHHGSDAAAACPTQQRSSDVDLFPIIVLVLAAIVGFETWNSERP